MEEQIQTNKTKEEILTEIDELKKQLPKIKRKPIRIYERVKEEDFINILNHKSCNQKYKFIFLLAYGSGLRIQEIINLKPEDIDFKKKMIHIVQGKGKKDRITLLAKQIKENYNSYLPINMTKAGIQKMFLKITLEIGLNNVIATYKTKNGKEKNIYKYHFHSLRHSFASNLLANGVPLNVVQEFLGHSNITTTGRYTKLTGEDAIAIAISKGL